MSDEIQFKRTIPAEPRDVFYAISTSQGWRDWLVDAAYFRAQPGGSFHLSWDSGWYASGSVEQLKGHDEVTLRWRGMDDPAATQVSIRLEPDGGNTLVTLSHSGFGEGEEWEASRKATEDGWETGLENLESIFDTGADLRITRRPILGIFGNDFDEEIAERLGVPVAEGTRLAGVIEGMGAEKAGLQGDDVIVEMDGAKMHSWEDLGTVLQRRQAGDTVGLVYYRGPERHEVQMELMGRPIPDLDLDPTAFAAEYRKVCAEAVVEITEALEGVSEVEAEFKDGEEWSVKEVLAHLIVDEEWNPLSINLFLDDNEPQYAGGGTNRRERLKAIIRTTPTVGQLVERLESSQEETCVLLEESSDVLGARKGVMWQLGNWWLSFPGGHVREHKDQIVKTLELARAAEPASA